MGNEAEVRAEKHGKETGIILANIANLGKNMEQGFERGEKRFDRIDKKFERSEKSATEEKIKVSELYAWYQAQKEIKTFVFKEVIKKFIPGIAKILIIIAGISGVGYACLK